YHYDDGDRVSHHDTSFRGVTHHTYDAAGNLLTASQAGLSLKHNRQTQCGNGVCRYDVYGRMVQKPGPGGLWRYGYDSEHRMKEAVLDTPDAAGAGITRHRVIFTYDPFGRRTEKRSVVTVSAPDDDGVTVTQEVTTFVWEGFRLLGETRNGQPLVYVYEGAGSYTPLARIYGTGDKQRVDYYRCSHNGMPQALTDEDGKLHWRQDVETWGETRSEYADEEGNRWRKKWDGAPEENLRFAGQYLDRETGLHYNTFRYYAPDMGRFITPDPIGLAGGLNLYQYAPNPLGWIDPLGLKCSHLAKNPKEFHSAINDKWGYKMTPADMREVQTTIDNIKLNRPAYPRDGITFENNFKISPDSQRLNTGSGPYREWTVKTPGVGNRGARRIVVDTSTGKAYYSHDHYDSFIEIDLGGWK
ncbi:TPA: RHS domain-containing protein, partial [Citrobacter sedlakii]|nr:RHS domain-containing protein [Citrobacter sedlakii]